MYYNLSQVNTRPRPWEFHTSDMLWTDTHIAENMMSFHLNETVDAASRNHAFIKDSVTWMTNRFSIGEDMRIADFGCGPGLYTLPLAQTGAKVTGIDFSENLCELCTRNLENFAIGRSNLSSWEVVYGDARDYSVPFEANVLFFNNPFDETIFVDVLDHIHTSLTKKPRRLILIYANMKPASENLLHDFGYTNSYSLKNEYSIFVKE